MKIGITRMYFEEVYIENASPSDRVKLKQQL